jgi:hypothetical protein
MGQGPTITEAGCQNTPPVRSEGLPGERTADLVAADDRRSPRADAAGGGPRLGTDRPDVVAVALVGSWARGDARPDSDVDLVVIVRDVAGYLAFPAWLAAFGEPGETVREASGTAPALRVWYADGPEVEFAVTTPDWCAADPVDPDTAAMGRSGLVVVYDPNGVAGTPGRGAPRS